VGEGEDPAGGLATRLGGWRRRADRILATSGFPKQRKIHPLVSNNLWVMLFSSFRLVNWGKNYGFRGGFRGIQFMDSYQIGLKFLWVN
jgi:hypothetical protein